MYLVLASRESASHREHQVFKENNDGGSGGEEEIRDVIKHHDDDVWNDCAMTTNTKECEVEPL